MAENNNSNEALREALDGVTGILEEILDAFERGTGGVLKSDIREAIKKARTAIAKPPRNCDVGSAEEQDERFRDFCPKYTHGGSSMDCAGCECGNTACFECSFVWGQLPCDKQPNNRNNEEQSK